MSTGLFDVQRVKVVNKSSNDLPQYKSAGASGMDLQADLDSEYLSYVAIPPGERMVIPTGLYMEIPEGYEIQIRSRSGLAAKEGVIVLNAPGTIDSDYRGEIKVILYNTGSEVVQVHHGDRIAQAVLQFVPSMYLSEVLNLDETERGEGGFGSTGK